MCDNSEEPFKIISWNVDSQTKNRISRYQQCAKTMGIYNADIIFLHEVAVGSESGFAALFSEYDLIHFAHDPDASYGSMILVRNNRAGFTAFVEKFETTNQGRWLVGIVINDMIIISCHAESGQRYPIPDIRASQFRRIREIIKINDHGNKHIFIGDLNTEGNVKWFSASQHGSKELPLHGGDKTWISSRCQGAHLNCDKHYDRAFVSKTMEATLTIIPSEQLEDGTFASDHEGLSLVIE